MCKNIACAADKSGWSILGKYIPSSFQSSRLTPDVSMMYENMQL